MRNILALCDLETAYAVRFMEYMNEKSNIPFEVHAFTGLDQLRSFVETRHVEILLISERAMRDEVNDWPIGKLVILSEGMQTGKRFNYPTVYKYQSSTAVVREVMAAYGSGDGEGRAETNREGHVMKPRTKVIGVYAPIGRCLKTSFAMAMGQILAGERPVLYLDLEGRSGFRTILHESYEADFSDLIYYIRKGKGQVAVKILQMVQKLGNMHYLPPLANGGQLGEVTCEEWHALFEAVRNDTGYEILMLDLGTVPERWPEILYECDLIYEPVQEDVMSAAKQKEFEMSLSGEELDMVAGRIRKIHLDGKSLPESKDRYFELLPYSGLGAFARSMISIDRI